MLIEDWIAQGFHNGIWILSFVNPAQVSHEQIYLPCIRQPVQCRHITRNTILIAPFHSCDGEQMDGSAPSPVLEWLF